MSRDRSALQDSEAERRSQPRCEWRTQLRISRCRDLGYCVIEVHEFDVTAPGAPPRIEYRVYREEHGFPVGQAIASFDTPERARRYAEELGGGTPTKQPAA